MGRVPRTKHAWHWGFSHCRHLFNNRLKQTMKETRSLGPPWASRLSRYHEHFLLPPGPSRAVLCPTSFKMAPRLSARCPPITLIGEPKGLLSVAGWWAGLVHPVPHCPCPLSRPRPTWRDATVCVRACCVCELQAAWHMHT